MAKKNKRFKVPNKVFGFKLSKGTRKDLKKLLKMVQKPDTRALAMSAAGGLVALLVERFGEQERDKLQDKVPRSAH